MRYLCDTNIFVGASLERHPFYSVACRWLYSIRNPDRIEFCRMTQNSFLRLLTQGLIPDQAPFNNYQAGDFLNQWMNHPYVCFAEEPQGLYSTWMKFSGTTKPSPKIWMDAYLAAFAIESKMCLVTFDRGFRHFEKEGLELKLLEA